MKFASILLLVFLGGVPAFSSAAEQIERSSLINWREAQPAAGETELDRLNRAFAQLADNSRPAIVQIRVSGTDVKGSQSLASRGSGFFIDPEGYILIAQHVIDKAKEIEVRLADGRRLPARLIAAETQIEIGRAHV